MVYIALSVLAISITVYVYSYGRRNGSQADSSSSSEKTINAQPATTNTQSLNRARKDGAGSRQKEKERMKDSPDQDDLESMPSGNHESPQTSPPTICAGPQVLQSGGAPSVILSNDFDGDSPERSNSDRKASSKEMPPQAVPEPPSAGPQTVRPSMAPPPPPPPTSTARQKSKTASSSLMPPPSRPPNAVNRLPGNPSSSLLPPPSAASTLRTPPSRSLAPTSSSLPPSSRPSKKVLLAPGHSPLDWAHLVNNPPNPKFMRGANVPSSLIRVPPSMLKFHNGRKRRDAWGVWQGKVYNMSPYKDFHPGGVDQLMRGAGKEGAEKLFLEIHPWVSWESMLGECLVGILVSEEDGKEGGKMDEMD